MPRKGYSVQGDLTPEENTPAPEATADVQASASEESAQAAAASEAQMSATMNALLRGELQGQAASSNQDADDTDDGGAEGSDGEPAPTGVAKPNDAQPGRRARRAEEATQRIAALEAENARIKAALDEVNPPPPDATEEARKARLENESRFRSLLLKPDTDTDWNADDWRWLQDEKAKRAIAPELRQHYDTVLEADRAALYGDVQARERAFLTAQAAQITTLASLPGVDGEALKAEASYERQGRMLYEAGRASVEAENKKLRDELAQIKREQFGTGPRVLSGGRSAPGKTFTEDGFMNGLIRGGR